MESSLKSTEEVAAQNEFESVLVYHSFFGV